MSGEMILGCVTGMVMYIVYSLVEAEHKYPVWSAFLLYAANFITVWMIFNIPAAIVATVLYTFIGTVLMATTWRKLIIEHNAKLDKAKHRFFETYKPRAPDAVVEYTTIEFSSNKPTTSTRQYTEEELYHNKLVDLSRYLRNNFNWSSKQDAELYVYGATTPATAEELAELVKLDVSQHRWVLFTAQFLWLRDVVKAGGDLTVVFAESCAEFVRNHTFTAASRKATQKVFEDI